jgi:hypothetical protein
VVAAREEPGESREDGRHPGGCRDPRLGALELADLLDQLVSVGIGEAAVDVPLDLVGEQRARLLGVVEDEARGEEDRDGMLAVGRAPGLGADGQRLGVKRSVHGGRLEGVTPPAPLET